jgi:glutathionylspermidine synthase
MRALCLRISSRAAPRLLNHVHFLRRPFAFRKKWPTNRKAWQASRTGVSQNEVDQMKNNVTAGVKARTTTRRDFRERAIARYHQLLAADKMLSPAVFEKLRDAMRTSRLLYGERPIGVALRPHLLERKQVEALTRAAESIARALEKIAAAAVKSPSLMKRLGLTDTEQRLAIVDPGFTGAAVTTRMDGFVYGEEIKFVEYNAENPSSLSDQEGLNRLLFDLPAMSIFAEQYRLQQFSPTEKLFETLLETYREWKGTGVPNIAILDWKNLPTSNEFVLLRDHFTAHGVRTIICSPDELEYDGRRLRCGDFDVDLVYKRVLIHEFLSRYDETHPLVRAYINHHVCLVNPFRCKIMHKKASFELLTDEAHRNWFTSSENEMITRSIPWTRRMAERRTTYKGRNIELINFVRHNRARLVLKPNDDYGGHGVYIGPRLDERAWDNAIATALSKDYVVQEAVDLYPEEFPIFSEIEWKLQPMFVDTNPFLFAGKVCGAMVRLSNSPIVNVTSGGGETGFFVIHDGA